MSCLHVNNVSKQFIRKEGKKKHIIQAVDHVSFELHEGESLGIIGPSGCGKTTLINIILGQIKPDSGSVHKSPSIGLVGQDPYSSLCPTMTVEKAVAEPLIFLKKRKNFCQCQREVEEILEFVNLSWRVYGNRLPAQLSGGERQRVGIARALITNPSLLLLDEPTSMLDQEVKGEIVSVIRAIVKKKNTAFLMVTHDILLASEICDRILVLCDGKIIEENTSAEIMNSPVQPLTRDLISISTDIKSYWDKHYLS
ncbi:MAG TPA: ABC transporter ATP-binding protein [Desulfitobacterium dehalogenans]|uniref:ABC transporter ATP-binding protein n=1 Tax=Desulfitobacterium dehalogenans TaxID=36854 RepID=A0A7C7DBX9_9FIRM|nr:ABC transporter ATP-binding protein [Desulfitobacterium dehalogenans]